MDKIQTAHLKKGNQNSKVFWKHILESICEKVENEKDFKSLIDENPCCIFQWKLSAHEESV